VVLLFKDGWGLAEHVPEAIRSRMAQQENGSNVHTKKRRKKKNRKQANPTKEVLVSSKVQEMAKAS